MDFWLSSPTIIPMGYWYIPCSHTLLHCSLTRGWDDTCDTISKDLQDNTLDLQKYTYLEWSSIAKVYLSAGGQSLITDRACAGSAHSSSFYQKGSVIVRFMLPDWAMECPDTYFNIILGMPVRVFLDKMDIWIFKLNRADCPGQCGWVPSRWRPE